jgi:hypothetical protein
MKVKRPQSCHKSQNTPSGYSEVNHEKDDSLDNSDVPTPNNFENALSGG